MKTIALVFAVLTAVFGIAPGAMAAGFVDYSYDFGTVYVGESACHDFTWKNTGDCWPNNCPTPPTRTLAVSTNNTSFRCVSNCNATVPGWGNTTVGICFYPEEDNGPYNGTAYSNPNPPLEGPGTDYLILEGEGRKRIQTNPVYVELKYGNVPTGTSKTMSFSLCNYYSSQISVTGASTNNGAFTFVPGTIGTVIPGNTCKSLSISFSPTSLGFQLGSFSVATTSGGSDSGSFQGYGVEAPPPPAVPAISPLGLAGLGLALGAVMYLSTRKRK